MPNTAHSRSSNVKVRQGGALPFTVCFTVETWHLNQLLKNFNNV